VKVFGATGLAKAKFRTKPAPPGTAELQLGTPNRMPSWSSAIPEKGAKTRSPAQTTVQKLTIEGKTCDGAMECDECDVTKNQKLKTKN